MASTGTIRKIVFAPASEVAKPTLPALGSNIDWDAIVATWPYVLGKLEDGDLGDLDEDTIEITPRHESILIDPPLAQNTEDEIIFKNGIELVTFTVYSFNNNLLGLSSTASHASGVVEEGLTITHRTMVIEVTGIGIHYFPKVRVKVAGMPGGVKELSKINFECPVRKTTSIPSGYQFKAFGT